VTCCISIEGGIEPKSKETTWMDLSIEGRGRDWNLSLRKSLTLFASSSSSFDQSISMDMALLTLGCLNRHKVRRSI